MKKSTAYILTGLLTLTGGVYMKSRMNPEFNWPDYFAGRDFRAELDARKYENSRLWDMSEEEYRARKEIQRRQDKKRYASEEDIEGEE